MKKDIAVMSIITKDNDRTGEMNAVLHERSPFIIGRMGLPYDTGRGRLHIISIALDAPVDVISSLAGDLEAIGGITVKTAFAGMEDER